jgi:hypothetical protein
VFEHTLKPTRHLILRIYNVPYHNCIYNRLPGEEVSGSKRVEDINIKNYNIKLEKVHLIGSCYIIILHCTESRYLSAS